MSEWTYADADGLFLPRGWIGDEEAAKANAPAGCVAVSGRHDHSRVRVDLSTGELSPYQPPAPEADEWTEWEWSADDWRWVARKTQAALERDARALRDSLLAETDWTQGRDIPDAVASLWAPYRKALRDWPESAGWPDSQLPIKPA
jgi:hypothetical protein